MVDLLTEIDPKFPYGPPVFEARLTLTTGVPITPSDVTGAGTLYCTPMRSGARVSNFENGAWITREFTQCSFTLSGVSTASRPYDVFLYNSSGTWTLDLVVWTSDTARATALATQDGVYVKSGATSRTYWGTVWLNSSKQATDSITDRMVWNQHNRVQRRLMKRESTASWTYTTATLREANGTTDVNRVAYVVGVDEQVFVEIDLLASAQNTNAGVSLEIAISNNAGTGGADVGPDIQTSSANNSVLLFARRKRYAILGRHYHTWLEKSAATGTTTWRGGDLCGLTGSIWG